MSLVSNNGDKCSQLNKIDQHGDRVAVPCKGSDGGHVTPGVPFSGNVPVIGTPARKNATDLPATGTYTGFGITRSATHYAKRSHRMEMNAARHGAQCRVGWYPA